MDRNFRRTLAAVLRPVLVGLGVIGVLIEEVLWAGLSRLMALLGRLPLVARLEDRIRTLPPYGAMVLFLLPVAVILPFKVAAVWLMAQGHFLSGLAVLLAAKVSGMAVWARLYALCHPSLSTLHWFVVLETTLLRWKAWAHDHLERLEAFRRARQMIRTGIEGVKSAIRQWVGEPGA
ncbi:MAG TPA: hypothetical protein VM661_14550 [Candidatus Sulfotelmatobacter sp.]|jgi:hypothetical protein|nr:hypothetical protein [Candidatus Sulfotelmatobacter sp.]